LTGASLSGQRIDVRDRALVPRAIGYVFRSLTFPADESDAWCGRPGIGAQASRGRRWRGDDVEGAAGDFGLP
jgi:hypothetical protein